MNKLNNDQNWLPTEDDDDEIIWVSKSELKRDAEALKKLGEELVDLSRAALEQIPLDEALQDEILLAQRSKKEAKRRQLQLIGKLLRQRDVEPFYQALDKLKNKHNQNTVVLHNLERWRDRLISEGDAAINALLVEYPHADRQQLRTLIRSAHKETQENKPPKTFRQLFQYLKQLSDNQ